MGQKETCSEAKNFILSLGCNTQKKMAHLTLEQRYKIEAYRSIGKSLSEIGSYIGKGKDVISRELSRNSDQRSGVYKADLAQRKTDARHSGKAKRGDFDGIVESNILYYLTTDYSPEQIVGRAKLESKKMVSAERIYQYIWQDKKKGGRLYRYLRSKGKKYAKRSGSKRSRGQIPNRVDIDQRPEIVEAKDRFGDLEIDLVIGKGHRQALLTINDRATGVLFMSKVRSKEAQVIKEATMELLKDWKPFMQTITSDNGKEFACHQAIAEGMEIDFFFAKPYHSWERGANENLNGLVRQYFPKGSEFADITQEQINHVVQTLNNRPRKRFGYKTPNEILAQKMEKFSNVAFIY
jgi:IS30 family transposase